jgi:ketosteroid isomerase-like protein
MEVRTMSNSKAVQAIYAAFGAGDVPAILAHLADNIDWEYSGAVAEVPYLQKRDGRDEVAGFFESLGVLEFHAFTPKEILDGGDVVVALIDIDVTVKATGKRLTEEDEIHVFRFNADGKVARFRHGVNTHATVLAFS